MVTNQQFSQYAKLFHSLNCLLISRIIRKVLHDKEATERALEIVIFLIFNFKHFNRPTTQMQQPQKVTFFIFHCSLFSTLNNLLLKRKLLNVQPNEQ